MVYPDGGDRQRCFFVDCNVGDPLEHSIGSAIGLRDITVGFPISQNKFYGSIANYDAENMRCPALDVNNDGRADIKDVALMMR